MYDEYDQRLQSLPRKLGNLPICIVVAKGQEDYPISEAKF